MLKEFLLCKKSNNGAKLTRKKDNEENSSAKRKKKKKHKQRRKKRKSLSKEHFGERRRHFQRKKVYFCLKFKKGFIERSWGTRQNYKELNELMNLNWNYTNIESKKIEIKYEKSWTLNQLIKSKFVKRQWIKAKNWQSEICNKISIIFLSQMNGLSWD